MRVLDCLSNPVMSGGLLHSLHWLLLLLSLSLMGFSAVGAIRISKKQKRRRQSRQNLINSVSGWNQSLSLGEVRTPKKLPSEKMSAPPWGETLATYVRHSLIIAEHRVRRSLGLDGRDQGTSKYAPVWFSAFCCGILALGMYGLAGRQVEWHDVHVLQDVGQFRYQLQIGAGTPFWTTFCSDYEPQFSAGQTLKVLKYEDRGSCWSVAYAHPAYLILRDERGIPIVRR